MKIKRFVAYILTCTILISSLPLSSFAKGVITLSNKTSTYSGKNINLDNWVEYTMPTFNGVPNRIPGDEAFYSGKGEIHLNINDQNRSYFENGGSVNIYVKKSNNKMHLNPLNWSEFLAYKPENGTNSFKIIDSKLTESKSLNSILSHYNIKKHPILILLIAGCLCYFRSCLSGAAFAGSSFVFPLIKDAASFILAPLDNLNNNAKENKIEFDYGIVLTDEKDEMVLNPDLPEVGEINQKALKNWKEENKKNQQILDGIKDSYPSIGGIPFRVNNVPKECYFTQIDIDKIKKEKEEHKNTTYSKLAYTVPSTDGLICKLDKDHKSQTFRLVINNQFPDNPNNADLFALALQNNSINLAQTDSKVNFVAEYNALSPETSLFERLINVSPEVQQKINLINNIGKPGFFSKIFSSICGLFKNNFYFGRKCSAPDSSENEDPSKSSKNNVTGLMSIFGNMFNKSNSGLGKRKAQSSSPINQSVSPQNSLIHSKNLSRKRANGLPLSKNKQPAQPKQNPQPTPQQNLQLTQQPFVIQFPLQFVSQPAPPQQTPQPAPPQQTPQPAPPPQQNSQPAPQPTQ